MTIVAIHQPNFYPWLGYFHKLYNADIFLFLDDVQFPKTGGVWCNRVKLLLMDDPRWITGAIQRNYNGKRQVREINYISNVSWRENMLKALQFNYCHHKFYKETMSVVEPLIINRENNLADYNINAIIQISINLGIDITKLRRSSSINVTGNSNELLINLTKAVGGTIYLSGDGSAGYLDNTIFDKHDLLVKKMNYNHPIYPQHGRNEFTSGLSIIDPIMNLGFEGVRGLIEKK